MSRFLRWARLVNRRTKYWILRHPFFSFIVFAALWSLLYFALVSQVDLSKDFRAYWDSIFGGILASVATYSLMHAYFLQRRGLGIREWLDFSRGKIWIIPSYLKHPSTRNLTTPYYTVPPFDAQATALLIETSRAAGHRYPDRQVVGSHRFRPELLRDNLVCLCLPERNQYSRLFLGLYYEIYCRDQEVRPQPETSDPYVRKYLEDGKLTENYYGLKQEWRTVGGKTFLEWMIKDFAMPVGEDWRRSSINLNPAVNVHVAEAENTDYCLILKAPNPFNLAASVLVVCGIHGIGTLGGALWIKENRHELYRDFPGTELAILLQIKYTTPTGADNYLDSTVSLPVSVRSSVADLRRGCPKNAGGIEVPSGQLAL